MTFAVDLYVTPFQGADVVLGVNCLRRLGPVTFDYSAFTISFIHHDRLVILSGKSPAALSICSSHLRRDINTNEICELFVLQVSPTDIDNHPPSIQPSAINELLRQFSVIFDQPTGLPPPWPWTCKRPPLPLPTLPERRNFSHDRSNAEGRNYTTKPQPLLLTGAACL